MAGGKLQLVNLIRKTYDFLSWREAITRLYEVKRRNGGRLVGLKISKFLLIKSKIQYDYEYWKDRILSKKFGKVEASRTCFICYFILNFQETDMWKLYTPRLNLLWRIKHHHSDFNALFAVISICIKLLWRGIIFKFITIWLPEMVEPVMRWHPNWYAPFAVKFSNMMSY